MRNYRIFITEDDPWYGATLEYHLSLNPDFIVHLFATGTDCINNLHLQPDLITIDFSLPDMPGDHLYKKIAEIHPTLPVIIISAQENVGVAVELLKLGVNDYIVKDDNTKDVLWNVINKVRNTQRLQQEVTKLRKELAIKYDFDNSLKGQSPELKKVFDLMEKAAQTNINVSISGESGTGKELVAKAIHYNSSRKAKKFEAVNMAAIPRELAESELFGHEKGAFTGALARKTGKFEEANGGTIFLDEIAELDLGLQAKILRVLQERELVRLGGNEIVKLNIRIIAATHKNLVEEVKQGHFREDLYYRLMGLPIVLPPLRDRGNDILILAQYFLNEFAKENKLTRIIFSAKAKDKLMAFNYPGNIRELKAVVELAAVMCKEAAIEEGDIIFSFSKGNEAFMMREQTMREYNIEIIKQFLQKYDNDVKLVSRKLDIGRSTIYKLIQTRTLVL
jgi:two-component system, NtrC family, response regulator AtoC